MFTGDSLRVGVYLIITCILCTQRLQVVLLVDAIFTIVTSFVGFIFAQEGLELYAVEGAAPDNLHVYLSQNRMIYQIMPALTFIINQNSNDITTKTAVAMSRFVGYVLSGTVMVVDHYGKGVFSDSHLMYGVVPCILWALVMGVHLAWTGSRVNAVVRRSKLNPYLNLDLAVLLLSAAADFLDPVTIGMHLDQNVDPVHEYLYRVNGALALGVATLSFIGHRFRNDDDKGAIFVTRVIVCFGWLVRIGFGRLNDTLPEGLGTNAFIAQTTLLLMPSLAAFIRNELWKPYTSPPRSRKAHVSGPGSKRSRSRSDSRKRRR